MGSGLLAVGVSGQGPSAFIRHGETGLLVEPNDVESLLRTLMSIFEQRPRTQRIAEAGRQLANSEFTWAKHAEKLSAVYREALDGR
jgi:glycosyltransferase involved in cell wall biosynthesis